LTLNGGELGDTMKQTARMAILSLALAITVSAIAQSKLEHTTIVINYFGKTDRPVFPIIISSSADEADWYKQKISSDLLSGFVREYIIRESTMKKIAAILSPDGEEKRPASHDGSRTSPALMLVIAKGHDSHEVTLEVAESLTFLGKTKQQVSRYPSLVKELSDMERRMN
jgi:hypothetical protein